VLEGNFKKGGRFPFDATSGLSFHKPPGFTFTTRNTVARQVGVFLRTGWERILTYTPDAVQDQTDVAFLTFLPTGAAVVQVDDIVYHTIGGQAQTFNACLPEHPASAAPAVLVIHGGGFWRGSNGSENSRNLCAALAEAGMAGFSVEYRLAPAYPYPAAVEDVQAAIQWLREPAQVEQFGIDPTRIGALGNSAGATLAIGTARRLRVLPLCTRSIRRMLRCSSRTRSTNSFPWHRLK
jgi:acetyl esterase/lipase